MTLSDQQHHPSGFHLTGAPHRGSVAKLEVVREGYVGGTSMAVRTPMARRIAVRRDDDLRHVAEDHRRQIPVSVAVTGETELDSPDPRDARCARQQPDPENKNGRRSSRSRWWRFGGIEPVTLVNAMKGGTTNHTRLRRNSFPSNEISVGEAGERFPWDRGGRGPG